MLNQSYKLRTGLPGFISLPAGATIEVTIPAGSVVCVLRLSSDDRDLAGVLWEGATYDVPVRDLQRCGTPFRSELLT